MKALLLCLGKLLFEFLKKRARVIVVCVLCVVCVSVCVVYGGGTS
jgi:hypothetical protein